MAGESLLASIRANDPRAVSALLDQGAPVNEPDDNGWSPLCWAAGVGNVELVRELVDRGADVFHSGRDQRTPYLIALAAEHLEAARVLREAEVQVDAVRARSSSLQSDLRPYCVAYPIALMRQFPGWQESGDSQRAASPAADAAGADDDVVFLHADLTVTSCIWPGEDVVFNNVTDEWRDFCDRVLGFRPADDLDLPRQTAVC